LHCKYKEFESNAENKIVDEEIIFLCVFARLGQNMIAQIKRASDLTPCPLKFFIRPEVLVKKPKQTYEKKFRNTII